MIQEDTGDTGRYRRIQEDKGDTGGYWWIQGDTGGYRGYRRKQGDREDTGDRIPRDTERYRGIQGDINFRGIQNDS